MNVPKLLRTTLFSVLALLLTGGLMAVQAQTVTVDEDGGEDATTISDGLNQLNTLEGSGGDGEATLEVVAGDYSDTDADVTANRPNISTLNVRVLRDPETVTDQLTIESLNLTGADVNLQSDGNGFLFVQSVGGAFAQVDLALQGGTLDIASARLLRFQDADNTGQSDEVRVLRVSGSSISGEAPNYKGDLDRLVYQLDGGGSPVTLTAGNELGTTTPSSADITRVVDLRVGGDGTVDEVEFPVSSLSVSTFAQTSEENVDVQGNFTVASGGVSSNGNVNVTGDFTIQSGGFTTGGNVTVGGNFDVQDGQVDVANSSDEVEVAGTFRIGEDTNTPLLTVTGSVNPGSVVGDLTFTSTIDRSSVTGSLVQVDGGAITFDNVTLDVEATGGTATPEHTFITDANSPASITVNGTLTVDPASDGNTDSDDITEIVSTNQETSSEGTNVSISEVATGSASDGSNNSDETYVDLTAAGDGSTSGTSITAAGGLTDVTLSDPNASVTLGDGTTVGGQLDNSGNGTVTISGNVTYNFKNPDFQTAASPIDNGTSGEIKVSANQTLTVDVADGAAGTVLNNNSTGVTGDGSLEFAGTTNNTYDVTTSGSQNNVLSVNSLATDVRLDIEDASAAATTSNVTVSDLTANARVRFGSGDVGDINVGTLVAEAAVDNVVQFGTGASNVGTVSLQSLTVRDDGAPGTTSTVSLASGGSVGPVIISDSLRADGEEMDFTNINETVSSTSTNLRVGGKVDINSSAADTEVDISGIETHIRGNFDRDGNPTAILTTSNSVVEFDGTSDAILSPGSKFTLNGDLVINKTDASVTMTEALAVTRNVNIVDSPSNEFILDDNLFLTSGTNGTITLNSTFDTPSGFFIIVDGSGVKSFQRTAGSATIPNLRISGGTANNVQITTNLEFDGTIELRNGGLDVTSGDFAPAAGSSAEVKRFLDNANADITENGGTFNNAGNAYDLSYATIAGTETRPVQNEITDAVDSLTVETGATIQLTSTESNSDPVTINDALTVQSDAQISDNGGARTINLAGSGITHRIVGEVEGANTGPVELNVTGPGSTIAGTTNNNPDGDGTADDAEIEDLTISSSGTTVADIQQITGDLMVANGSSLSLGLSNADGTSFTNPGDQTIQGNLTVNDTLSLDTNVEVNSLNSGVTSPVVDIDGANAYLDFGTSYLHVSNGGNVDGDGDAMYAGNGGFAFGGGGGTSELGTASVAVPEVIVNTGINVVEGVGVTDSLDVKADITLDNSDLTYSGDAVFKGGDVETLGNGEEFVSKGTTVFLQSNAAVGNFVVDSGNSETTVTTDNGSTLEVDTKFEMRSGDLGQNADIDVTGGQVTYGANAGAINWSSGDLIFSNVDKTFALEKDFTIPYLRVTTNVGYGDAENILIGSELELDAQFHFSGGDGSLQITDDVTIRRDSYAGSDVLDEKPVFPSSGQYDVVYTSFGTHSASYELDDAAGTIRNIDVSGGLDVDAKSGPDLTGDVTVNGTLSLLGGTIDHGDPNATDSERQIVMADNSMLVRNGGSFVDGDPVEHAASDASYTLVYENGTLDAEDEEFLDTGRINLVTRTDDGSPSSGNTLDVMPSAPRTVQQFRMENGPRDITSLSDASGENDANYTLTVKDSTFLDGGQLAVVGAGETLNSDGYAEVNGATVASNVEAAGDFVFNSGSLGRVNLAFDGSSNQLFQLAQSAVVGRLELNQQGGSLSDPLQVEFDGPPLGVRNRLTLTSGLFVVDDPSDPNDNDEFIAVGQVGPGAPFGGTSSQNLPTADIIHDPSGTLSHVVGKFQHGIPAGAPGNNNGQGRFEWPVGSMTEYRPAAITFTNSDPIDTNTNIRIRHVDRNPRGTGGLGNIAGIGSYPAQYWDVEATTGVSTSQQFDLQFETGTSTFVDQFDNADNLRIIRRFDGSVEQNDWLLQGSQDGYQNALFNRNGKQFTSIRANSSRGGLVTQGTRFTIGLPSRLPGFLASSFDPSDLTIDEGETLTASFLASSRDLDQSLTALDTTNIPSDAQEFVTTESFNTDSTATDSIQVTFAPDQSFVTTSGSRDVSLTVQAEDGDGTSDSTFTVTVNNVADAPSIASAPTAPVVARDTGRTAAGHAQFEVTAVVNDPNGGPLSFSASTAWAMVDSTYSAGTDSTTAVIGLTPGFPEAQTVANSGPLSLNVVTTDDATSLTDTASVEVDVRFDRNVGDVNGDGEIRAGDAGDALDIAVGKTTIGGLPLIDAQIRAADFNPPSEGDTLDADRSEVRAFDAFGIFNAAFGGSSVAAKSASAESSLDSEDASLRIKDPKVKNGTATLPVVLSGNAANVQSADLTVELDGKIGAVKSVDTQLPNGWMSAHNTLKDGTFKMAMAGQSALSEGTVATIRVNLKSSDAEVKPEGTFRLNASSVQDLEVKIVPDEFALKGNYPNPVSQSTTIQYKVAKTSHVTVEVYDMLGRRVATLVDAKKQAGVHKVNWSASGGKDLSSGVYFYRMNAGDFSATKRMTVVR